MSSFHKICLLVISASLLLAGAVGCGNGSNNDQGTSFLALGFFADGEGEAGDAGRQVALSSSVGQGFPNSSDVPGFSEDAGGFIGLQNRLSSQFIRVDRVDCQHSIAGASIAIPADTTRITTVISPSPLPEDDAARVFSTQYVQVSIVSTDILQFLNANIASLPQLPFRMVSTCSAVGVTQAGDVLRTNEVFYEINFVETRGCCDDTEEEEEA